MYTRECETLSKHIAAAAQFTFSRTRAVYDRPTFFLCFVLVSIVTLTMADGKLLPHFFFIFGDVQPSLYFSLLVWLQCDRRTSHTGTHTHTLAGRDAHTYRYINILRQFHTSHTNFDISLFWDFFFRAVVVSMPRKCLHNQCLYVQ